MNNIDEYLDIAKTTAVYPGAGEGKIDEMAYLGLGLSGEVGELNEICKKILRDSPHIDWSDRVVDNLTAEQDVKVLGELGDIVWYWVMMCAFFNYDPSYVLQCNLAKLASRKERGVLAGSGDNR